MSGDRDDYEAVVAQMKIAARLRMEIAKIYADVDAMIFRNAAALEFDRATVLYALRDVSRLRSEAFENVIAEMREERNEAKRRAAIDAASRTERDPARRLN